MSERPDVVGEIKEILDKVEKWKQYSSTTDRGSYCENSSSEYKRARAVIEAYNKLIDALEEERRKG